MVRQRRNKRAAMLAAAVRVAARNGVKAASVRSIAQEAGVTEGALYRHYPSKEELCFEAYKAIVTEMWRAKRAIARSQVPIGEKLRAWVKLSFEYYDRYPDPFTFVLLTPHNFPGARGTITRKQGKIFMEMIAQGQASGEIRRMAPELALTYFSGVMLNVPRQINEGLLPGPAALYAADVMSAVKRILLIEKK